MNLRTLIAIKNFFIRVQIMLTILYEISCVSVVPFLFFAKWGNGDISAGTFILGLFVYELPMLFHLGIFGEKVKKITDKLLKW